MRLDTVGNRLYLTFAANVAGVYAHLVAPAFDCRNGKFIRKMYIRYNGQFTFAFKFGNCARVAFVKHGNPHDFTARRAERVYLRGRCRYIGSFMRAHRLNFNAFGTADFNAAYAYDFGFSSFHSKI